MLSSMASKPRILSTTHLSMESLLSLSLSLQESNHITVQATTGLEERPFLPQRQEPPPRHG